MKDNPLDMDQVRKMINEAVQSHPKTGNGAARTARPKLADEQKAANRAKNDAEVVRVFTEKGYSNVVPRVTVRTYDLWLQAGRIVKKGEKSIRVGSFNLFHETQTEATAKPN